MNLQGSYPASTSIKFQSKNTEKNEEAPVGKTADNGGSGDVSGDRPPIAKRYVLLPATEALALAADRVLSRRAVAVSTVARGGRKGVA